MIYSNGLNILIQGQKHDLRYLMICKTIELGILTKIQSFHRLYEIFCETTFQFKSNEISFSLTYSLQPVLLTENDGTE